MGTLVVFLCVVFIIFLSIRSMMNDKKKCGPGGCFGCSKCNDFSDIKEQYYQDNG